MHMRRPPHPAPPPPRAQRGFAFLMVLVLLVIATTMIGWFLARVSLQNHISTLQVAEYRRHHELMGLRDLVQHFASDRDHRDLLDEYVMEGGLAHQIVLPSGDTISLLIHDAQGGALTRLDPDLSEDQRYRMFDILSRLPANQKHLFRRVGPMGISLFGAPDEVVRAAAGDNFDLADDILDLRTDPEINVGQFTQQLRERGHEQDVVQDIQTVFTFSPTTFRVDAEVEEEGGAVRRYVVTIQRNGNIVTIVETKALGAGALFPPVFRPYDPEWGESELAAFYALPSEGDQGDGRTLIDPTTLTAPEGADDQGDDQ